MWKYAKATELLEIPHRARIAWLASTIGRITSMYPVSFLTQYHLEKPVNLAWNWVDSGSYDEATTSSLAQLIDQSAIDLENDGYSGQIALPGFYLLLEIREATAVAAATSANFIGTLYAQAVLLHQGKRFSEMPDDALSKIERTALGYAYRVFQLTAQLPQQNIHRGYADLVQIESIA
ncbi:MAG TPA: hypothetical protein VGE74_08850 [Gemmata sp.]